MDVIQDPSYNGNCYAISGNTGKIEYRPWIGFKKNIYDNNKVLKVLEQIYFNMKQDELEMLATMNSKKYKKISRRLQY